jgi:hypothetical protein
MNLKKKDILLIYCYLKKFAKRLFERGKIESSVEHIELCSKIAYHFNFFYFDEELENILFRDADIIGSQIDLNFIPVKERYAFIDTNGSDNHGLTQQYIRALISAEVEFAYIYEDTDLSRITLILEELKAYPKASIFTFDKSYSYTVRTQKILKFLSEYKPEKYLMHIMPWDVVAVMVCYLIKGVTRYNINATDHAFWLGSSCIDYNIEFRNYGYSVSLDKRGLKELQLLFLPYYPVQNKVDFEGFSDFIANARIKIFSGGSFYKIYGDGGLYFSIIKSILNENPDAVLLYAGNGDSSTMEKFIKLNGLQKRIFLLGNRKDINQVFEQADIYLSTYPIAGGLMSQLAAVNGKPILAYTNQNLSCNFIEGVICHQAFRNITFTDLNDFYEYARKLCKNSELRVSEGSYLKECIIPSHIFNTELRYLLSNNKNMRMFKYEELDYDYFADIYLEVENKFIPSFQILLASKLKLKLIYISPKISLNIAIVLAKRFLNTLKKIYDKVNI